jgi:hypothetical protein
LTAHEERSPLSANPGQPRVVLRRFARGAASRAPWLIDAYRFVHNPRWELDLWRDLCITTRGAAFLRSLPPPAEHAPAVLVALYRDNIYETKLGLVLATALRLQGYQPVVSMPTNRAHRVRRYARAFGVDRVVAQDQLLLSTDEADECRRAAQRLLASSTEFDTVKQWTFRDWSVGNHVLSTLIRTTFDGSPDLKGAANHDRLAAILDDVLCNYVRAERLVDGLSPHYLLVDEANYSTNGPLVDVAVDRGIDVIQTIGIWREDALLSKRLTKTNRRVDAKSVAPETLARVEQELWTDEHDRELDRDFDARYNRVWKLGRQFQPATEARSAERIIGELGLDPSLPTAVIFAHVLWDASLFFGVDLFQNYSDWLVRSVGAAVDNPNVNWIVKAHPSNVFRAAHGDVSGESSEVALIRESFADLPAHVHLLLPETGISTLSLYQFADYGVTVRGTPGMEMACFAKPVFTAGTGTYAGLGFTYDSSSAGEFLERLKVIETYGRLPPDMTRRARRYAHTLFTRRPWPTRSFALEFKFPERGWHPLDRNVMLVADSVGAIDRASDLNDWARWVVDDQDADYLPEVSSEH